MTNSKQKMPFTIFFLTYKRFAARGADAVDVLMVIIDRHVENVTTARSARAISRVMVYNWFTSFVACL